MKKIIFIIVTGTAMLHASEYLCELSINSAAKYMKKLGDTTNPITKKKVEADTLHMLSEAYANCGAYLTKEEIDKALAEGAARL